MNAEGPVYEFEKSKRETIRAAVTRFNGKDYADLRTYYRAEPDGGEEQLAPSKKGITVRLELLPELKKAVDALLAAAGQRRAAAEEREP